VHNLFLLQLAETGVVGFVGLLVVGGSFGLASLRLLRSSDALLAAVGSGFAAVLVFFLVEEQFVFSLRQEHPATLFWIAAGLVAACGAMAGTEPYRLRQADLLAHGDLPAGAPAPSLGTRLRATLDGIARTLVHRIRSATGRAVAVAASAAAPRRGRPAPRHAMERAGARSRWRGLILGTRRWGIALRMLVALALVAPMLLGPVASTEPVGIADAEVVMTLRDRDTGRQSIWTMHGDGTGLQRLTPDDGMTYAWSEWAFNGTKIVFSARSGPAGSPEGIYLMNPDGSGRQQLADNPWQNGQPRVSPDGTQLLFTSAWDEYQKFALYSMDLATGLVRNLSATTSQAGAVDSDAKWVTDDQIVFATSFDETGAVIPTQIATMRGDGSGRQHITADRYYNTDPEVSPDGRTVVWAAYRGEGEAGTGDDGDDRFKVKLQDWFLVTQDLATGVQRTLNQGGPCAARPVSQPCGPLEGPAYIPNWVPGGSSIAYLSILSRTRVCLCAVGADGTGGEVVFASDEDEIQWFDIAVPGAPPAAGPERFRTEAPESRLLIGGTGHDGGPLLAAAEPDRFGELALARLATILLEPFSARWAPDRSQIAFSALLPNVPEPAGYGPPPPAGQHRQRHFTLAFVSQYFFPPTERQDAARRQVFVMGTDGRGVRQVTSATTEDYRDAIPDGEVRGNIEPAFSPDGRYLVVTNVSELSRESFLLRIDLLTGDVLNLTNGTAGAMPTADFNPEWSPDGRHVAFSTAVGGSTQIAVVDRNGMGYRQITDDDHVNLAPAWSPDGTQLVYASYRGSDPIIVTDDLLAGGDAHLNMEGWALVRVDVRSGAQTVLTAPDLSPTLNPVWSPEGDQIAFISVSGPPLQPDVWVIGADGSDPRPLQVTLLSKETSVDWR
jgi:Tol biopolymer transport system component